ncbi:hypothetical protein BD410DRAFT_833485 [Rickenella mellea]|uniref:Uncharacterized protein n=1 Tax=Rickenella mellea TaxID=50990 RepID=A0A4R5XDR6_9AGAM|nr:hypothetical protein BD410DRAFT_833485 [Rickenella mellea]
MADTPAIQPTVSLRQTTQDSPCPFCLHQRWMPLWKRLLHNGASSARDEESVVPLNAPNERSAANTRSPPVAISFVNGESPIRPVSEIVEALTNQKSSGVPFVTISRNEINAVVQALKVFLRNRNRITKAPSKHQIPSVAQPALRRCRSLP